jgi:hypothetical protein
MTAIAITDLTAGTLDGAGAFDKLMIATKAHLESEFNKNRITGPQYATVYLGALDVTMNMAMQFVLQRQRIDLEAQLLTQQILLAQVEVTKAEAAVRLVEQEILNSQAQLLILEANKDKIASEIAHIDAQTLLIGQQKANAITENALIVANTNKVNADAANAPKQGLVLDAQKLDIIQKTANAVIEGQVLVATECKLRAEYDLIMANKLKAGAENSLLVQKTVTERAQTQALGVDDNSVIGKQKSLYTAQTNGFARDAEQKAAQMLIGTWNSRRMTDEGTVADGVNMLNDATLGRAVTKLLAGVNA